MNTALHQCRRILRQPKHKEGPWSQEDLDWLIDCVCRSHPTFNDKMREAEAHLQRSPKAIGRKLSKMGYHSALTYRIR